ncbi:MAG: DUF3181 family protein [Prochlorotrichaceae cyanobacterium]
MGRLNDRIDTLAEQLGDRFYLDVGKWHLYLKDANLHEVLAERFYALIEENRVELTAIEAVLEDVRVTVGGGRNQIAVLHFLPVGVEKDILAILQELKDDW